MDGPASTSCIKQTLTAAKTSIVDGLKSGSPKARVACIITMAGALSGIVAGVRKAENIPLTEVDAPFLAAVSIVGGFLLDKLRLYLVDRYASQSNQDDLQYLQLQDSVEQGSASFLRSRAPSVSPDVHVQMDPPPVSQDRLSTLPPRQTSIQEEGGTGSRKGRSPSPTCRV